MKLFVTAALTTLLLTSCLKESISDSLLASTNPATPSGPVATFSYDLNGQHVSYDEGIYCDRTIISPSTYPTYILGSESSNGGDFVFTLPTDTLTVADYHYKLSYTGADIYVLSSSLGNCYLNSAGDSVDLNITSYSNGYISGNFSFVLTPALSEGPTIFGTPGSVIITNGVFQNMPVVYF